MPNNFFLNKMPSTIGKVQHFLENLKSVGDFQTYYEALEYLCKDFGILGKILLISRDVREVLDGDDF